ITGGRGVAGDLGPDRVPESGRRVGQGRRARAAGGGDRLGEGGAGGGTRGALREVLVFTRIGCAPQSQVDEAVLLQVVHAVTSSSRDRSWSSPRRMWLLTVPSGRPRASAMSSCRRSS